MTAPSKSRLSWAYQGTAGTEAIDAANSLSYFFGIFSTDCDKWSCPFTTNDVEAHWNYDSRAPHLTPIEKKYETYMISFHPTTPQYLAWMLKKPEDKATDEINLLETGLWATPLTIRWDFTGGTIDKVIQTVDNYCIGLHCIASDRSAFLVQCEFAYGRLEDNRGEQKYRDVVSAVNGGAKTITLTATTLTANQAAGWLVFVRDGTDENSTYTVASNTAHASTPVLTVTTTPNMSAADNIILFDKARPILTTVPLHPGNDPTNVKYLYNGKPQVIWDAGGENTAFNEVWKAEWQINQDWKGVIDEDGVYQTVYHYTFEPVNIILNAILETNKQVTDYIDREVRDLHIKIWKPDLTNYVLHKFTNCHYITHQETGRRNKGHWEAVIILRAEYCTAEFLWESTDTWGDHFK